MTNDVGILRALQTEVSVLVGATIIILMVLWLARRLINRAASEMNAQTSEVLAWRRHAGFAALTIWVLVLVGTAVSAASMAFSLRVPRSDVDGRAVYEQMEKHK